MEVKLDHSGSIWYQPQFVTGTFDLETIQYSDSHCHCHYLRWRMPPFMRQCPMHETTGMGKLINAALLTLLMRRV